MKFTSWAVAILLLLPISALAVFKPARVLIPEAFGVHCNEQNLCIDDVSQFTAAQSLLNDSKSYLAAQWGLSIGEPKIIFCSTEQCRSVFGLSNQAGFTLGSFAIAIAPRGWQQHYVAHELIHHWQADQFGSLALLSGEQWLIEGMAYALSNDPRVVLHEPFESYRQRFNDWYRVNRLVKTPGIFPLTRACCDFLRRNRSSSRVLADFPLFKVLFYPDESGPWAVFRRTSP